MTTESPWFKTEAELCAKFISALPKGWTSYAETAGWDILLVRDADGFQIGIQAKMSFTAQALEQCLDDHYAMVNSEGPDCRAVLVPYGTVQNHLHRIATHLGVTVISCKPSLQAKDGGRYGSLFTPGLPEVGTDLSWWAERDWHEMAPASRCSLPEYVPDVAAGTAAPLQLTNWKIKALKIAATLEIRGFVTRQDFRYHKLDHRRWIVPGNPWLVIENGVFVKGPQMPDFEKQHPRVFAEIKRDSAKWLPPTEAGAPTMI